MLFNSPSFLLLFLPATLIAFYASSAVIPGRRAWVLLIASAIFYGAWDVRFLPLLGASIAANWWLSRRLNRDRSRRSLWAGIGGNLLLLVAFKYLDFFGQASVSVLGSEWRSLNWVLPLGLSFFTFQQITFLVDSFRRVIEPPRLRDYALAIGFFPHLIAGPIVQPKELLPQIATLHTDQPVAWEHIAKAMAFIIAGLGKKVLLADTLAQYVDPVFAQPHALTFFDAWSAALGYSLQLYLDFSGYCEIAMGLALLFGIQLPINFSSPYQAVSIADFWRRWHITLGRFLREYIYIPLGGSRHGRARAMLAVWVTFVLGGLWHGAGWTFVVWGAMHAAYMCVAILWNALGAKLPVGVSRLVTLLAVVSAWVMFRAQHVEDAVAMYRAMWGFEGLTLPPVFEQFSWIGAGVRFVQSPFFNGTELIGFLALMTVLIRARSVPQQLEGLIPRTRTLCALAALALCVAFNLGQATTFLYFQF